MQPGFNPKDHFNNPDTLVKWESVAQIIVPVSKPSTCPICLSPPTAARVTKCGHIFCWPCMQHYIALSEHSWRKCPICFESIYSAALKSVLFVETRVYENATSSKPIEIVFKLMKRSVSSTVALPLQAFNKLKTMIPSIDLPSASQFSKLLSSNIDYITKEILGKDQSDLEALLASIKGADQETDYETSFIEMCLSLIKVYYFK